MNALQNTGIHEAISLPVEGLEIFGDISDPCSEWYDLKVAEMSGYDYIFAPAERYAQLTDLAVLEEFLIHTQTLLGSEPQRTILVGYATNPDGKKIFEKYNINWADDTITECMRCRLDNTPQLEFIEMLYKHSEKLLLRI